MTVCSGRSDGDAWLRREALYGDDFTRPELTREYEKENGADGDIWGEVLAEQGYSYHTLNLCHGFAWLPADRSAPALASSYTDGAELAPLTGPDRVRSVEPGQRFHGGCLVGVETTWHRPASGPHGLTNLVARKAGRPVLATRVVVSVGEPLCRLTASRLAYHATTLVQKLPPTDVFLALRVHPSGGAGRAS